MTKLLAAKWFEELAKDQQTQLLMLRALILKADSAVVEELKWGQPCYKLNKHFAFVQKAKAHVTLGFQHGARFDGAERLMGEGKDMRHMRFKLGEKIDERECATFIAQALRFDRHQFGKASAQ